MRSFEARQDASDLIADKHNGQALWLSCSLDVGNIRKVLFQHIAIEKKQSTKGNGLRRCGNPALDCEIGDEGANLSFGHLAWMSFAVKQNEAANPIYVSLLSTYAEVALASNRAHLIQQPRLGVHLLSLS